MQSFRIEFSELDILELHRRIDATRWPLMPFDSGWSAGTDDSTLRSLVRYWRTEFDWFEVQAELNRHVHLRGPSGDPEVDLHCVVIGPTRDQRGALPLLLLHGWPGSFIELLPAAELLASGKAGRSPFEVVVPSLPGFGFSDAPRRPGMHPGRIAEYMHLLMQELGYTRYGVQGGDWGAIIGSRLAELYPDAVVGLHLNFPPLLPPPDPGVDSPEEETGWRLRLTDWRRREGAYSALQGTKPQTLAYSLNDSPVGLLAWILEKFWAWSDHGGDLWEAFDPDMVLANVTLYWLTGTPLSAARTYFERQHEHPPHVPLSRIETPTAFARFPGEPWAPPRVAIERVYRLERWRELPRGGHFAALEQPELFAGDVASFFTSLC